MAFPHEVLVEFFRDGPGLPRPLLQQRAQVAVRGETAESGASDLTQVASTEFRADAVSVFKTGGEVTEAVIVEVQLQVDRDKEYTWPVYVAALRARLRCPVVLLVIAPDPQVASWAREPIALGHPGLSLVPVVVTYDDVPRIVDPAVAVAAPQLALLSGLAHAADARALAPAVAAALGVVSADARKLYSLCRIRHNRIYAASRIMPSRGAGSSGAAEHASA